MDSGPDAGPTGHGRGGEGASRRTRRTRAGDERARSHRAARRLALAAVFEAEFGQRTPDAILERHLADEADQATAAYARELTANVAQYRDALDQEITTVAPQYPVVSLARMDRALLRCGLCEVLHSPATPARVAIAEWVELARVYSGDPMRRLMNGVLGRVARDQKGTRRDTPA